MSNIGIITLDVQLSVEVKEQVMLARLLFCNNTSDKLYLDKYTICLDGKFRNKIFEIIESDGRKVNYSGFMMKRIVKPEHFIILNIGEKIEVSLNLIDAYKLVKGQKYVVQFCAHNPRLIKEKPLMEMVSNKVEVIY